MGYQTAWEGAFKDLLALLQLPHNHAYLAGWRHAANMWKVILKLCMQRLCCMRVCARIVAASGRITHTSTW